MNSNKSKRIVCIIDACYSGAVKLIDSKMKSKGLAKEEANLALATYDKIWRRIPKAEGRYLLLSCQAYGQSFAIGNDNSLYTKYLMEGLNGVGLTYTTGFDHPISSVDDDGNVTPETLHNYVYQKVANVSDQIPRLKVDKASDIIIATYPGLANPRKGGGLLKLLLGNRVEEFNNFRLQNSSVKLDFGVRIFIKRISAGRSW